MRYLGNKLETIVKEGIWKIEFISTREDLFKYSIYKDFSLLFLDFVNSALFPFFEQNNFFSRSNDISLGSSHGKVFCAYLKKIVLEANLMESCHQATKEWDFINRKKREQIDGMKPPLDEYRKEMNKSSLQLMSYLLYDCPDAKVSL